MKNINTNNKWYKCYTIPKLAESKMDVMGILGRLVYARGNKDSLTFKGRDLGLKSAQLRALCRYDIIEVVDTEEIWVKVSEDNMVRKSINIYAFNTNISPLLEDIKNYKMSKITGRLEKVKSEMEVLQTQIDLLNGIDRAYDKGFADGSRDSEDGDVFNYLANNPYPENSDEFERYICGYEDGYEEE